MDEAYGCLAQTHANISNTCKKHTQTETKSSRTLLLFAFVSWVIGKVALVLFDRLFNFPSSPPGGDPLTCILTSWNLEKNFVEHIHKRGISRIVRDWFVGHEVEHLLAQDFASLYTNARTTCLPMACATFFCLCQHGARWMAYQSDLPLRRRARSAT